MALDKQRDRSLGLTKQLCCVAIVICGVGTGLAEAATGPQANTESDASEALTINRDLLDQSLQLGRAFLLANQRQDGTFRYHINFLTGVAEPEQDPVRQAGALWGLALIHQDQPSDTTRGAVLRGLDFFRKHSALIGQQERYIQFPGVPEGKAGTVALVTLALIDFLRSEPPDAHPNLRRELREYLQFLISLRRYDLRFHKYYLVSSGEGHGAPSPYFDGEILLALVKCARYHGREDLRPMCLASAETMFEAYVDQAVRDRRDDDLTKGFYQWGSMAFLELSDAGWEGTEQYASRTVLMAQWMIDVHRVLQRKRNTAYAYEGIISAYHLARATGETESAEKFRRVIAQGLGKLITWQVGGPQPPAYLQAHREYDSRCRGGVLSSPGDPRLRIDTTQHQMHAVILARRYVWP
jgi:UDP-N-acetylmuramoyl-tripeptide--D-alanyl-D-alanine ligase